MTEERIREVLAALPALLRTEAQAPDEALARDFARVLELHGFVTVGLDLARQAAAAAVERGGEEAAEAQALCRRLASVTPEEEAAVLATRPEIEAAIARLRAA